MEDSFVMPGPDGFTYARRKNGDVVVEHHGRAATVLRGRKAAEFLEDAASGDDQELMATGHRQLQARQRARRDEPSPQPPLSSQCCGGRRLGHQNRPQVGGSGDQASPSVGSGCSPQRTPSCRCCDHRRHTCAELPTTATIEQFESSRRHLDAVTMMLRCQHANDDQDLGRSVSRRERACGQDGANRRRCARGCGASGVEPAGSDRSRELRRSGIRFRRVLPGIDLTSNASVRNVLDDGESLDAVR